MWKLKRPEALLDYYSFNEEEVRLGHAVDVSNDLTDREDTPDIAFIPYRFGMDLEKVKSAIIEGAEDTQVIFYLNTLEVYGLAGELDDELETKRLEVPKGVTSLWFLKTEGNIETHEEKLIFIDSCPHTWDGIDKVFLITVDIGTNHWRQQSLGEPDFIKDCLQEFCRLNADTVTGWGNDHFRLELVDDGTQLDITSGFNGEYTRTVPCVWKEDKWVVDKGKLASENIF